MPENIAESGKKHSADTMAKIQHVHDTVTGMGASCDPSNTGSNATLPGAASMGIWNADRSVAVNEAGGLLMGDSHDELRSSLSKALGNGSGSDYGYVRDVFDKHVIHGSGGKLFKQSYTKDTSKKPVEVKLGNDKKQVHLAYVEHPATSKAVDEASRVAFLTAEEVQTAEADHDMAFKAAGGLALTEKLDLCDDVAIVESAASETPRPLPVKLIAPGWGSSGYYPANVLERDGPAIFKAGTHMYWNHASDAEEKQRPEGDLKHLAAVLTEDAKYNANGPKGPGLYSYYKPFADYAHQIKEKGPYIGTSIRAYGKGATGEREGRKGTVIEALTVGRSLDFVTKAGAGGMVFEESAKNETTDHSGKSFAKDTQQAVSGQQPPIQEGDKDSMTAEEQTKLQEAVLLNSQENARLKSQLIQRDAKDFLQSTLAETIRSGAKLHTMTTDRIVAECMVSFPLNEAKDDLDRPKFAQMIADKVKTETDYLVKVGGKRLVEGLGATVAPNLSEADYEKQAEEIYSDPTFGLSAAGAKFAAHGK